MDKRPDLVLINKKSLICHLVNFAISVYHSESKAKILTNRWSCQRAANAVEHEGDVILIVVEIFGLGYWRSEEEMRPSRPELC